MKLAMGFVHTLINVEILVLLCALGLRPVVYVEYSKTVGDSLAGCRPVTVSPFTTVLHEVTSCAISITLNDAHNTITSHSPKLTPGQL